MQSALGQENRDSYQEFLHVLFCRTRAVDAFPYPNDDTQHKQTARAKNQSYQEELKRQVDTI